MSRLFYHVMQDNLGNLLFGVSGTMRLAGSGTLATIYGDEGLTVILSNPMTNHPSFGSFKCFLGAGYYDFSMAKPGYTFETLAGVQGHGTMAQQDASAVAITGGSATGLTGLAVGGPGYGDERLAVRYLKSSQFGLCVSPSDNDTGAYAALMFRSSVGATVGAIITNASSTAYNTSSDARLKESIAPLVGALDVVRALRPVTFRWQADGSTGHGFLAHELMQTIPEMVSGLPDEVNPDGTIKPQQVDHSKLVPWLTAAIQALSEQVAALVGVAQDAHEQRAALEARVVSLEHQLSV